MRKLPFVLLAIGTAGYSTCGGGNAPATRVMLAAALPACPYGLPVESVSLTGGVLPENDPTAPWVLLPGSTGMITATATGLEIKSGTAGFGNLLQGGATWRRNEPSLAVAPSVAMHTRVSMALGGFFSAGSSEVTSVATTDRAFSLWAHQGDPTSQSANSLELELATQKLLLPISWSSPHDIVLTLDRQAGVSVFIDGVGPVLSAAYTDGMPIVDPCPGTQCGINVAPIPATSVQFGGAVVSYIAPASMAIDSLDYQICGAQYVPPPVITAPMANQSLASTSVRVAGRSLAGTTVTVQLDGVAIGSAVASSVGRFYLDTVAGTGPHVATASAALGALLSGTSDPIQFDVDTTPPSAPTITWPTEGASIPGTRIDVSGTAPGASQILVKDLVTGAVALGDIDSDGAFHATISTGYGPHTLVAISTDLASNSSGQSNVVHVNSSGLSATTGGNGITVTGGGVVFQSLVAGIDTASISADLNVDGAQISPNHHAGGGQGAAFETVLMTVMHVTDATGDTVYHSQPRIERLEEADAGLDQAVTTAAQWNGVDDGGNAVAEGNYVAHVVVNAGVARILPTTTSVFDPQLATAVDVPLHVYASTRRFALWQALQANLGSPNGVSIKGVQTSQQPEVVWTRDRVAAAVFGNVLGPNPTIDAPTRLQAFLANNSELFAALPATVAALTDETERGLPDGGRIVRLIASVGGYRVLPVSVEGIFGADGSLFSVTAHRLATRLPPLPSQLVSQGVAEQAAIEYIASVIPNSPTVQSVSLTTRAPIFVDTVFGIRLCWRVGARSGRAAASEQGIANADYLVDALTGRVVGSRKPKAKKTIPISVSIEQERQYNTPDFAALSMSRTFQTNLTLQRDYDGAGSDPGDTRLAWGPIEPLQNGFFYILPFGGFTDYNYPETIATDPSCTFSPCKRSYQPDWYNRGTTAFWQMQTELQFIRSQGFSWAPNNQSGAEADPPPVSVKVDDDGDVSTASGAYDPIMGDIYLWSRYDGGPSDLSLDVSDNTSTALLYTPAHEFFHHLDAVTSDGWTWWGSVGADNLHEGMAETAEELMRAVGKVAVAQPTSGACLPGTIPDPTCSSVACSARRPCAFGQCHSGYCYRDCSSASDCRMNQCTISQGGTVGFCAKDGPATVCGPVVPVPSEYRVPFLPALAAATSEETAVGIADPIHEAFDGISPATMRYCAANLVSGSQQGRNPKNRVWENCVGLNDSNGKVYYPGNNIERWGGCLDVAAPGAADVYAACSTAADCPSYAMADAVCDSANLCRYRVCNDDLSNRGECVVSAPQVVWHDPRSSRAWADWIWAPAVAANEPRGWLGFGNYEMTTDMNVINATMQNMREELSLFHRADAYPDIFDLMLATAWYTDHDEGVQTWARKFRWVTQYMYPSPRGVSTPYDKLNTVLNWHGFNRDLEAGCRAVSSWYCGD